MTTIQERASELPGDPMTTPTPPTPDLRIIGTIFSSHASPEGTPIQPTYAAESRGEVVVDERYADALDDLGGFDRIWLLYWCHRASDWKPKIVPFRDTVRRGLFATRVPSRPNSIGLSVVRLLGRSGRRLDISDVDVVDGTPLLDIKPYVPMFDSHPDARAGWFEAGSTKRTRADDRFHANDR
jgi:tRNA (adenine37-N6)-methyltransferase